MTSAEASSLRRGLAVVELVVARGKVTLPQVALHLKLPKATAHRLLEALVDAAWLERHPAGSGYCAGPTLLRMRAVPAATWVGDVCEPSLVGLAARSRRTANLAVRVGDRLVYERSVSGADRVSAQVEVGCDVPVHATGLGKAYLAALAPTEVDRLLPPGPLPRFTERTVVARHEVLDEVAHARAQGWAQDQGECEPGSCCVAVAVRDRDGAPLAVVSVSGPDHWFSRDQTPRVVALVEASAAELAARLQRPDLRPAAC